MNVNINKTVFMFSDNVPTVRLAEWPLTASMWDGELLNGPVPTLFSEDIKSTEDGLRGWYNL